MDVFKVLSRSTKLLNNKVNKSSPISDLPSAGNVVNPQLYHDATDESRGIKRKRVSEGLAVNALSEDQETVDFFAPKMTGPDLQKKSANYSKPEPTHLMTEDECRRVLHSHRMKFTLLKSSENHKKKSSHRSKNEKKRKKPEPNNGPKYIYPQPLMSFSDLRNIYRVSNRILANLEEQAFKIPTEVQMASLPLLLNPQLALGSSAHEINGENINFLAIAPTGSGKTLAFLIPIINQILQRRRQNSEKPFHVLEAIVVVPTKELSDQILNEAKILSKGMGVKVSGMRKGMRLVNCDESIQDVSSDEDEDHTVTDSHLKSCSSQPITKADILITTPGLLLMSLSSSNSSTHLSLPTVRTLVLDEADVLLDPLFREQTLSIWSTLTSPYLCTTLWSATISSSVESLALSIISRRIANQKSIIRLVIGLKDSALPTISHSLTYCGTENGKLLALRNLLHSSSSKGANSPKTLCPPIIIFTQTIPRATALHAELLYDIPTQAGGSSRIAVLHSSLSSNARSATLKRFRNGEIWVLITTDLLSRGVDLRGLNAVVNYDIPNDAAGYIHRVGRTGRGGRRGGVAVTFYTQEDIPFIRGVVNVIEASRKAAEGLDHKTSEKSAAWLLELLPKLNKKEKKKLKVRGVETRREDLKKSANKDAGKNGKKGEYSIKRISTRSGYERKLENRKRGAIEASKKRATKALNTKTEREKESFDDGSDWEGIKD